MNNSEHLIPTTSFYGRSHIQRICVENPFVPDPNVSEEESDSEDPVDNIFDDDSEDPDTDNPEHVAKNTTQAAGKQQEVNDRNTHAYWRKYNPVQFDVTYNGPRLPPPPYEQISPIEYIKIFF